MCSTTVTEPILTKRKPAGQLLVKNCAELNKKATNCLVAATTRSLRQECLNAFERHEFSTTAQLKKKVVGRKDTHYLYFLEMQGTDTIHSATCRLQYDCNRAQDNCRLCTARSE